MTSSLPGCIERAQVHGVNPMHAWFIGILMFVFGAGTGVQDSGLPQDIPNGVLLRPGLACGGQPTEAQLRALSRAGYRTVIDNRLPEERRPFDEAEVARRLGLRYVNIPVGGPETITPEVLARFVRALEESPGPIFMHCRSGNRSAQLYYGYLRFKGLSAEQALAEARRAGMRDVSALPYLERAVARLLARQQGKSKPNTGGYR